MRCIKISLLLLAVISGSGISAAAPSTEPAAIRAELTRQIPNCTVVAENASRMLLQTPRNSAAIVAEWHDFCPGTTELTLYELAANLNTVNESSPQLTESLWAFINAKRKCRTCAPSGEFKHLLAELAAKSDPQSDDAKSLKEYFEHGYYALRASVARANTGRLRSFYLKERENSKNGVSYSMAITTGAWMPAGNLALLGNHPSLGFNFHAGYHHFFLGLAFDFRFVSAPVAYNFYNPNTNAIERTNTFFGLFFGPDFRYEFWQNQVFALFVVTGLGYDLITHYAANRYSREKPAYSESFNVNAGLAMRVYFSEEGAGYAEIDVRYHRAGYSDGGRGGQDLSGNYVTAIVAFGYKINFGNL